MPSAEKLLEDVRVGARIRELRVQRSLPNFALADTVGISRGHLSNIESGRSSATPEIRAAIAAALAVAVEDLEAAS